jgi:inorganic pyrophosphatase
MMNVRMTRRPGSTILFLIACAGVVPLPAAQHEPPRTLPPAAIEKFNQTMDEAQRHRRHLWRDTSPFPRDGVVSAYIEIPRGERRKFEFDMARNARAVDRVIPAEIGGYPVNYGFVPQTLSFDGDPFDALVLGPPLRGGRLVQGAVVGLMQMVDDRLIDSKVVLSPVDRRGQILYRLSALDRERIAAFFDRYKAHEGVETSVPGWGDGAAGWAFLRATHLFFLEPTAR